MKKILWMTTFFGIGSISAMIQPSSLPVGVLQAIADEAAKADDELTAEDQRIITAFEARDYGEEVGKLVQAARPKNRLMVKQLLEKEYEKIMQQMQYRQEKRKQIFSAQLEQAVLEARKMGFSDPETARLLTSLIKESGSQPAAKRLEWISEQLKEAGTRRREEDAARRATEEANTIAVEQVQAGLNRVAAAMGMQIKFAPGVTLDDVMTGITTQAKRMIQTVKQISPDLLSALKNGNFDQAQALTGGNACPAVQQAIAIGQEAKTDALRTVGIAVPDLDKKMDMIRERYGDEYIDDVQAEINSKNYQIIDVIGYTLIVDSKSGDVANPFTSELVRECSAAIKKNEFDTSSELFFANNDSKTVRKLKLTIREKDQSVVLSSYVERSKRKSIDAFTSEAIAEVLNPLLKQRSLFNEEQFNRLAVTINGDTKLRLQEEDMTVLFRNHYQLLNDAAALHKLSIDRTSFISTLEQLPLKIEEDLKKIETNIVLVSGAMTTLKDTKISTRLKGIIDKSNNIVRSARLLLQSLENVRTNARHYDAKAFERAVKSFDDTQQVIGDFYGFLSNNDILQGRSNVNIAKALGENENIISKILMLSSRIMENILIEKCMPQPKRNLKSISFTNFIDTLSKSINMFLDETGDKQKLLETDNCSYYFQTAGISEKIYAGELCAELVSSSIKLLGSVYKGDYIDEKKFSDFKQVIELISQVQPIGNVKESVGQIIKQAKDILSALEDIREFCNCLSQYNKAKNALNNSVPLSVQFVTNQKMPIDANFSNMLSAIRNKIDADLESAIHAYSVSNEYPLQKKIAFLINADYGMIGGVAVGIPFRVGCLIQRPSHHIQMMNLAKAVIQQPYLFHGYEIAGAETKINTKVKSVVEKIINGDNISDFTQQFKKDIDTFMSTIAKAKRAYIPEYVERESAPVGSSLHAIILTTKAEEMDQHVLTLCLLDAIVSRPKILADIRAGSMNKLFESNGVDVDLISKLSAYVKPLKEIKGYLDNKLSAYTAKAPLSPEKNQIFNVIRYKTGESFLSALERITKSLEGLSAPAKKEQVKTPESIARQVTIQAQFNIKAAANILSVLSIDEVVAVLQNVEERYVNGILDNIELTKRDEVRNRLNR